LRKAIALLLISLFFLASCGRQQAPVEEIDNRAHYLKAKKYYYLYQLRGVVDLKQTNKELEWKLDKYKKTLGELDLAVFETTGDAREEVMEMIEECNDNIDSIRGQLDKRARNIQEYESRSADEPRHKSTWTKEEMRAAGMDGIGSSQNDAIAASRAEIERKRSAVGAE
jgi:hypothetical protein